MQVENDLMEAVSWTTIFFFFTFCLKYKNGKNTFS